MFTQTKMQTGIQKSRIDHSDKGLYGPSYDLCVIDVSGSMRERDYRPSRLAAAKEACRGYIEDKAKQRPDDYAGIVVFSDEAEVISPLLRVGSSANEIIASLQSVRSKYSTDFCAGLKMAKKLLCPSQKSWNNLFSAIGMADAQTPVPEDAYLHTLILSDGNHNGEGDPVRLARRLKERKGIVIDCVGIGSRSQVDEELLRQIASTDEYGRPRYRFIGDKQALLKEFRRIASLRIC